MKQKRKEMSKVPNLRFPEFSGEWETKKLAELMEFKITNSFSRENLNYESGTVKNIHYGDIHTKFQTLFDITKEIAPYINEDISIHKISEDFYCKEGDIIFADASEDLNDVGKSIEIVYLNNEKLLSGLHTLLARPKATYFHKGFNGYLFKSNSVRLQIQKEAQGTKVLSISAKRISNIKLTYPSILEQKKISDLLILIDDRIIAQSKIIEHLKTSIKGLSYQLFIKRLRFKNVEENGFPVWKYVRLKEVFQRSTLKNNNGKLKYVLTNSATQGIVSQNEYFDKDIANQNNLQGYYIVDVDDFVYNPRISQMAQVGPLKRNNLAKGVMSPLYTILKPIKGNLDFFEFYFETTIWHKYMKSIANYGARFDRMNISISDFENLPIPFPDNEEQIKIANFISVIFNKIESERKLLTAYENQKKYLLQNMFI